MKKYIVKLIINGAMLGSLILLPINSLAIGLFNTDTSYLVIPEVDVDGKVFYDKVTLKLNFSNGTFELIDANRKPEAISNVPLDMMEEHDIKMDFMGCKRSGRNDVTCHIKLTSLGGVDQKISSYANTTAYNNSTSYLYDNLGNTYKATKTSLGNLESSYLVTSTLVGGVPTLTTFKFKNISPQASGISLLKPQFGDSRDQFTGDFRNIKF